MTPQDRITKYREELAASVPAFLIPRRFVAAETWTKATTDGIRYLGLFRENEPDLAAILMHKRLLILGEPGAGKSTIAYSITTHLLSDTPSKELPVLARLKSFDGSLRDLLTKSTPLDVLDAAGVTRCYVFDGIDEVPASYRTALRDELTMLMSSDPAARVVLTCRQAFHAQHIKVFPDGMIVFHLLNFDDRDIKSFAADRGVDVDGFLTAVRKADCEDEVGNPFVLGVMIDRYKDNGGLSPLRSDNVGYVVDRLIHSRPLINATRQKRALRMLAIACETAGRNELTEEEALCVLREAIDISPEGAREVLEELSHSILVRTGAGISFQMRSYGEFLAADELADKDMDRVKELAFQGDVPIDTWLNTITYLAETNDKVRRYFVRHHPQWLVNVSLEAFSVDERTQMAERVIGEVNAAQKYILNESFSIRRLAHLLTASVITSLKTQLAGGDAHVVANALVLLAAYERADVVPLALKLATEHRNASSLRYSAIVALIHSGDASVVGDLIAFALRDDVYYVNILDAIGSLCTPKDFPRVLPLLEHTQAGLSATFYHFRELKTREALVAVIDYLRVNPGTLNGHNLDSYLEPVIDLIPEFWGSEIAVTLGELLAELERVHFHRGKLGQRLIARIAQKDLEGLAIQAMVGSLIREGRRIHHLGFEIPPLITPQAAQWLAEHAAEYAMDIASWLPFGSIRQILAPLPSEALKERDDYLAQQLAEDQRRNAETKTARAEQQNTIATARDIGAIIVAAEQLRIEHWPEISAAQIEWLAGEVNNLLVKLDLGRSITWQSENTWTRPRGLPELLQLVAYYRLHLANDIPIIQALRAWPEKAISDYCRREGLSAAADRELLGLLMTVDNENIVQNVFSFLRSSEYNSPDLRAQLAIVAADPARKPRFRRESIERLCAFDKPTDLLVHLTKDPELSIRDQAFRLLVEQQHQATIRRGLAKLTDDELRAGEIPFPQSSPLDWVGKIASDFALDDLKNLRLRVLALELWRATQLVTGTIANLDKFKAAALMRQQMPQTPSSWREHFEQEAERLEREGRIETAQQRPFDRVIQKLKGTTSMIRVKVWCEGSTDRPILRRLLQELGEHEISETIAFVGGWANVLAEQQPERWLDGCRQAVMILDGDQGRKLNKKNQPLTDVAKTLERRFANHPLKLRVLKRYGIENYFPRQACERVLNRDLGAYFPIPPQKRIEEHFREPMRFWQHLMNWLRGRRLPSFYAKKLNEKVADYLTFADVETTDLGEMMLEVKNTAVEARRY